jgi:predicted MFS family arabinose efflux permease
MFDIAGAIKTVAGLVDDLHTSQEEKDTLKIKLVTAWTSMTEKILDYEAQIAKAKADIITAEARGRSWLQRNWRPMLMVTIVVIVANNYVIFPYLSLFTDKVKVLELPSQLFTLMSLGVGGYIAGRSGEKIAEKVAERFRRKEEDR